MSLFFVSNSSREPDISYSFERKEGRNGSVSRNVMCESLLKSDVACESIHVIGGLTQPGFAGIKHPLRGMLAVSGSVAGGAEQFLVRKRECFCRGKQHAQWGIEQYKVERRIGRRSLTCQPYFLSILSFFIIILKCNKNFKLK